MLYRGLPLKKLLLTKIECGREPSEPSQMEGEEMVKTSKIMIESP